MILLSSLNCAFHRIALSFLVFLLTYNNLSAQDTLEPFSIIRIQADLSFNINNNIIHRYWYPSGGAEFFFETPFYVGDFQAGILLMKFNGKATNYPDFSGNLLYAGLGENFNIPLETQLYAGIKFGYFFMDFDNTSLNKYERSEREFAAGVNLRLSKIILENLYLSASYNLIFLYTHERLRFYFFSAGAAYQFTTPGWLKEFFK